MTRRPISWPRVAVISVAVAWLAFLGWAVMPRAELPAPIREAAR